MGEGIRKVLERGLNTMTYDCVIIGGGIAGLQCAIQLGRYMHRIVVIDAGDGRSTWSRSYHNILGYPDGISGMKLRELGYQQAKQYGVEFVLDRVEQVEKQANGFVATTAKGDMYRGTCMLFATGVADRLPDLPDLMPCLGKSVYICPDCDGYEIKDQACLVIGSGKVGANAAITLTYWSKEIALINHEKKEVDEKTREKLRANGIPCYDEEITKVLVSRDDEEQFQGVCLADGTVLRANHAFIALGQNDVKTDLASQLGVERLENKHIVVDARSKMTSVNGVWAAGDIVAHSEQVTVAMADGLQAAIWIHKALSGSGSWL